MALYAGQGLIAGLWVAILVPTLQQQGVRIEDMIGTLAWGGLPWVLKAPAAPLIDRVCGASSGTRRRNLLLVLQLGLALCFFSVDLSDTSTSGLRALSLTWLVANVLMSLQDVLADAAAIDLVPDASQGRARSLMLLSSTLGAGFFGSVGLAALARTFGAHTLGPALSLAFVCIAAFVCLPGAGWRGRPPHREPHDAETLTPLRPLLRTAAIWSLFALAASLGNGLVSGVAGYYLLGTLGFPIERYQTELLPAVSAVTLVVYLGLAGVLDRLGPRRWLLIGGFLTSAVWVAFAVLGTLASHDLVLFGLGIIEAVGLAVTLGALHAILMRAAPSRLRATFFALSMAAINLGQMVLGPMLAGVLASPIGYRGVFALAGVIHITAVTAFARWDRIKAGARPPRTVPSK